MGETCKTRTVQINRQGLVAGAKGVNPHVKLPAPEQQWVLKVSLAHVLFYGRVPAGCLPLGNVPDFVKDEDASTLALGRLKLYISLTGFIIQRLLESF